MNRLLIDRGDGVHLAAVHTPGAGPLVVFLPGYMSDMEGTKALHLEAWAQRSGRPFLRLDYSGCGASQGGFADGSIRRWAADAGAIIDHVTDGPVVPVGSSMGGWVMLHLALALGPRAAALVGIAAAPDFTRWGMTDAERAHAGRAGRFTRPSAYADTPYVYYRALIEEGAELLDAPIGIDAPVRLLHGQRDPDVPWDLSLRLAERLRSGDVQVVLVKDGDHRLSRPQDLRLLEHTLETLCASLS